MGAGLKKAHVANNPFGFLVDEFCHVVRISHTEALKTQRFAFFRCCSEIRFCQHDTSYLENLVYVECFCRDHLYAPFTRAQGNLSSATQYYHFKITLYQQETYAKLISLYSLPQLRLAVWQHFKHQQNNVQRTSLLVSKRLIERLPRSRIVVRSRGRVWQP